MTSPAMVPMPTASELPHGAMLIRNGTIRIPSHKDQLNLLNDVKLECLEQMVQSPPVANDSSHCPAIWDGIMCWPAAPSEQIAQQSCANYINGFRISETASKWCTEDGTWFENPFNNQTWTNYTLCLDPFFREKKLPDQPYSDLLASHMPILRVIYNTGYGISLVALIVAVIIMIAFKKLHCPRNTLHVNLFITCILRSVVTFIKENAMISSLGFSADLLLNDAGVYEFIEGSSLWKCRLLICIYQYCLAANYAWIFVEGLYLHTLIFVTVFNDSSGIRPYIMMGWLTPLTYLIPWAIVRATLENTYCWTIHTNINYTWIFKAPNILIVTINFVFFVNIVRVLFTKLKASNTPEARKYRYKKLARSTLVLIPLFGVHYMLFVAVPDYNIPPILELVKIYLEITSNSFQGFLVALLYCFLNGEVQSEIRKKWQRFQLRRGSGGLRGSNRSTSATASTYFTRGRNSMYSTTSVVAADKVENVHLVNGLRQPLQLHDSSNGNENGTGPAGYASKQRDAVPVGAHAGRARRSEPERGSLLGPRDDFLSENTMSETMTSEIGDYVMEDGRASLRQSESRM